MFSTSLVDISSSGLLLVSCDVGELCVLHEPERVRPFSGHLNHARERIPSQMLQLLLQSMQPLLCPYLLLPPRHQPTQKFTDCIDAFVYR